MARLTADSVDEFIEAAGAKWGKGRMGETTPDPRWTYGGFRNGQVVRLVFSFSSTVEFAEEGGGKPDANNRKAIKEMAKLAKEHEQNHKKSYDKAFKDWKPDKQAKELMKTVFDDKADAEKAMKAKFAELQKELLNACLELHGKEGTVTAKPNGDGTYDVTMKPTGPGGCR